MSSKPSFSSAHSNSDKKRSDSAVWMEEERCTKNDTIVDEQDWARTIVSVPSSTGNIIEDLQGDEGVSVFSITTDFGGEHGSISNEVDLGDDLDDIFDPTKETSTIADQIKVDFTDSDPLHNNALVVLGDDYDANMTTGDNKNRTPNLVTNTPMRRPKTSKINPMSGQKALTDDKQEWRNDILSSFARIVTPNKGKRKEKPTLKRKYKIKSTMEDKKRSPIEKPHTYSLRRGSITNSNANEYLTNPLFQSSGSTSGHRKRRLLQEIESFNNPSLKSFNGAGSVSVHAKPMFGNQGQTLRKTGNTKSALSRPLATGAVAVLNTKYLMRGTMSSTKRVSKAKPKKETSKNRKARNSCSNQNRDTTTNMSIRIAKNFRFKPQGCEGRTKWKTYFGTVVSKRGVQKTKSYVWTLYHVVYDDGDEEDFNSRELKQALDLYEASKELDGETKCEPSLEPEDERKNPQNTEEIHQLPQLSNKRIEVVLHNHGQSTTKQGSSLQKDLTPANSFTRNSEAAKNMKLQKRECTGCAQVQIDISKKRKHLNQRQERQKCQRCYYDLTQTREVVDLSKEQASDDDSVQVLDLIDLS